ncbi:hypothetical protein FKP32DRAFT_1674276 [Trametes sanguinea]|nr:hypothetical protein FKP32DRAFT_1674276 [Trametes sanguinea]
MSHPSPSASLASLPATEDTPASPSASTTTLLPVKSSQEEPAAAKAPVKSTPAVKNYEEAFGRLSSSYGFAGSTPAKNPTKASKEKKKKRKDKKAEVQAEQGGSGQGQSPPK